MSKLYLSTLLLAIISISSCTQKSSKAELEFTSESQKSEQTDLNLMPLPKELKRGEGVFEINSDFKIFIENDVDKASRVYKASTRFIRFITNKSGIFIKDGFAKTSEKSKGKSTLTISFDQISTVEIGVDESYHLKVDKNKIEIVATTDIGAMHGLSTLLQLATVIDGQYVFPQVEIKDEPRFMWRGLMMDVARHYMPVHVIERNLDAMAFVKLNVFHWHLSDDQGFRVEVKSLPKLHKNASDGQYYSHEEIKKIVKYADDRGIRVVPEFDVPGHGTAILTAYPELASKKGIAYNLERNSGIFDPTLNPTIESTYVFMNTLFKEMSQLFPDQYVHIGGDENEGKHWDENEEIQSFMKEKNLHDNHALQTYFNIRLEKTLSQYGKTLMGWEEIMTENMPKTALIHSWKGVNEGMEPGESLVKAVKNGYQTILSNGYYIDLLLSVKDHYLVDPMPDVDLSEDERKRVLGGEITMWSELVTPLTIDTRIWPRSAAIAERFWSQKDITDVPNMFDRLESISNSLELLGITHLQVKDYLLRNIANYQNTSALIELSNISEPYKIYSRNAGGKQYQSYSPFTLFADACTADAKEVRYFSALVTEYIETKSQVSKKSIQAYLVKWQMIRENLELISENAPLVNRILPYATRLEGIAVLSLRALESEKFSDKDARKMELLMLKDEDQPSNLDVELAVKDDIIRLMNFIQGKGNLSTKIKP